MRRGASCRTKSMTARISGAGSAQSICARPSIASQTVSRTPIRWASFPTTPRIRVHLANIAEGYGRGSRNDYIRFLRVARGSACEVETELIVAQRLGLLEGEPVKKAFTQLREVRQLLQVLVRALENSLGRRLPSRCLPSPHCLSPISNSRLFLPSPLHKLNVYP
jgi:hypothetical protein